MYPNLINLPDYLAQNKECIKVYQDSKTQYMIAGTEILNGILNDLFLLETLWCSFILVFPIRTFTSTLISS